MLYHVKACQQYKALLANQDASQSKFTFESVPSEGDGGTGICKNLMIAKYSEKIFETLCELIIVDEIPFSTVDRMGFKKLFKILEP